MPPSPVTVLLFLVTAQLLISAGYGNWTLVEDIILMVYFRETLAFPPCIKVFPLLVFFSIFNASVHMDLACLVPRLRPSTCFSTGLILVHSRTTFMSLACRVLTAFLITTLGSACLTTLQFYWRSCSHSVTVLGNLP